MLCKRRYAFARDAFASEEDHLTLVLARAARLASAMGQIEFDSHHLRLHHGKQTTDDRATDHQDGSST